MIKVLIIDLDKTLIDTAVLEPLRSSGNWREIQKYFNQCQLYENVSGLINTARAAGINVAIFTNAPSVYSGALLKYFDVTVDYVVAYHDVEKHKPNSEGVDKILTHFGVTNDEAVYLGDHDLDFGAANSSGVEFFSVEWGSVTNIDVSHIGVARLSEFIGNHLGERDPGVSRSELQKRENRFYLGYYLEGIKQEVFEFKNGTQSAVRRWIEKSVELAENLPEIDIVVRALGHAELTVPAAQEKPLDYLGSGLATAIDATYKPDLLQKDRELVKSTQLGTSRRRNQVQGAYSIDADQVEEPADKELTFLVVDDVLTTGATTDEITRAISESFPNASIYIFALVKTLYRTEAGKASTEIQHNTQLFSDLYDPVVQDVSLASDQEITQPRKRKRKLATKEYSANYTRTNHNFVFQNLPLYSIASEPASSSIFSTIQILKNILQRGKPTVASRRLRNVFGIDQSQSGTETKPLALISRNSVEWIRLIRGHDRSGKNPAKYFFDELIQKYLGNYGFLKQLTVPEVQIFTTTQVYIDQYHNRQVDFFIPHIGIIIEIDGPQHQHSKDVDEMRNAFAETHGLKTVRFTTQEVMSESSGFLKKMEVIRAYAQRIHNLEQDGVLIPPNGITLRDYRSAFEDGIDRSDSRLQLSAAMRFQLLLLELLETGALRLGQTRKMLLINRDRIDFAWDALEDLNEIMANLFRLQNIPEQFIDIEIEELDDVPDQRAGEDLIVDFSVLERYDDRFQTNQDIVYSRSHYLDFYRYFPKKDAISIEVCSLVDYDFFQISCAEPVEYSLDLSPNSAQRESLRYFLSNLFLPYLDEVDFREGQVGIIGSALSRNGTIGLLPTGSGKSICYQLSAVLQPAISFVVCPIKSLMYDQKTDLDSIGFTRSNYITSELTPAEKAKVQRDYGAGKYFFVFISPERFQTNSFRKQMEAIGLDLAFSYAVIDEAHCLSEWGHDFRTSYLNLANTIEKFAPSASYIGLTATASVNVLKDIQIEFSVPNNYVRTPIDFTREELSFHVIDDKGKKDEKVVELVREMEVKWNGKDESSKAGIIFTPTVNGSKGCHSLAGRLSMQLQMDVRFFSGSAPRNVGLEGSKFETYKREVQDDFKVNKFYLLTATKAFGMGVNKGNIAYTVHFGIPGSMEALYQEAGRAGRDKRLFEEEPADCYVLLTKEQDVGLLDKIWDSSATVDDLKMYAKALSRNSDVNTNMFFIASGLDTINNEFNLINSIYKVFEEYKAQGTIRLRAGQFGVEKLKFEKSIYRLSQLEIVQDWVIEDFFKGDLSIDFNCPSEDELEYNIENTIKKYEPDFHLDDVFTSENDYYKYVCKRYKEGVFSKTEFIFLVLLLWSYDHFVYNRRQSLKTVYEQCGDLAAGRINEKEFKDRLEGYFKFNDSSHRLLHLAENTTDVSTWLSVFFEELEENVEPVIISIDALLTLKEQLARFLESYKDNACLNYLSGVVRLAADQFDDADGERRMSSSIDNLLAQDRDAAWSLIRQTLQLKPLFSKDAQNRLARLIDEKFNNIRVLEEVNRKLGDAYSYQRLLTPLVSRLESLTNRYKGIEW